MVKTILGIDISKEKFDVSLLIDSEKTNKIFNNNKKGFLDLKKWLNTNKIQFKNLHVCLEATGGYEEKLAEYLYDNCCKVSVVNPARIEGFAQSQLSRVKTDKSDSQLIADFCKIMKPDLWKPTPNHIKELQQRVRRLDSLIFMKNQETNRLEKLSIKSITYVGIQRHIKFLDKEILKLEKEIILYIKDHKDLKSKYDLLISIPGIVNKTINVILAFLSNINDFASVKQMIAFIGINPKPRQSGSSVRGISKISKTGDVYLRKAFYMPALVAIKYNPLIKEFSERLTKKGKHKMVILIACMRKLLHIIFGVLKSNTLFDGNIKT